jgi:hypothetical protein
VADSVAGEEEGDDSGAAAFFAESGLTDLVSDAPASEGLLSVELLPLPLDA